MPDSFDCKSSIEYVRELLAEGYDQNGIPCFLVRWEGQKDGTRDEWVDHDQIFDKTCINVYRRSHPNRKLEQVNSVINQNLSYVSMDFLAEIGAELDSESDLTKSLLASKSNSDNANLIANNASDVQKLSPNIEKKSDRDKAN